MLEDVNLKYVGMRTPLGCCKGLLRGFIRPSSCVLFTNNDVCCHLSTSNSSGQLKVSHCCPGKLRGLLCYVVPAVVKKSSLVFAGILSCP